MERHGGNLKCALLRKRSHSEKGTYCVIPTTQRSGKGNYVQRVKTVLGRGEGGMSGQSKGEF